MGVGIHETGNDQAIARIVPSRGAGDQRTGRADRGDLSVFDQQVLAIGRS